MASTGAFDLLDRGPCFLRKVEDVDPALGQDDPHATRLAVRFRRSRIFLPLLKAGTDFCGTATCAPAHLDL